jgi:hypothetical protein
MYVRQLYFNELTGHRQHRKFRNESANTKKYKHDRIFQKTIWQQH